MRTAEEVEGFFIELELPYERLDDGMWVITDTDGHHENIVVYVVDAIISVRVKVVDLPANPPIEFYRRLLTLNASEMLHVAYGIEEEAVVITGALELENLDGNEFQAVLDAVSLALSTHHGMLADLLASADGADASA